MSPGLDVSDQSRRDERTQSAVLTPGTSKKMVRPEGAAGRGFGLGNVGLGLTNYLPPFQGGFMGWIYPWGKTPG